MSACRTLCLGVLVALGLVRSVSAGSIKPATPAPNPEAMKDGLAVLYYFEIYNNIDELVDFMGRKKGKPGPPLATLDYKVGPGAVLTSGSSNFVGAHITGFIHLAEAGTYAFKVTSNDGVRLSLGGKMIYEDPEVHADWTSDPIVVPIETAGWYPLDVLYFEKKNTSTLILEWKPPGASGYDIVPTTVLKHSGAS